MARAVCIGGSEKVFVTGGLDGEQWGATGEEGAGLLGGEEKRRGAERKREALLNG